MSRDDYRRELDRRAQGDALHRHEMGLVRRVGQETAQRAATREVVERYLEQHGDEARMQPPSQRAGGPSTGVGDRGEIRRLRSQVNRLSRQLAAAERQVSEEKLLNRQRGAAIAEMSTELRHALDEVERLRAAVAASEVVGVRDCLR